MIFQKSKGVGWHRNKLVQFNERENVVMAVAFVLTKRVGDQYNYEGVRHRSSIVVIG